MRTICGIDTGSWPTPTAANRVRDAETLAKCAAFRKRNANQNTVPLYLEEVVRNTVWPTPTVNDSRGGRNNTSGRSNPDSKHHSGTTLCDAVWPTPTSRDHKDGPYCPNVPVNGLLGRTVWPTPTSLAHAKDGNNEAGNSAGLVAIRKHAMATGSPERTEKPGALNPAFVCWLMGYPTGWASCGASVTRSTPARRKPSSKPS